MSTRFGTRLSASVGDIAQIAVNTTNIAGSSVDNTSFRADQLYMRMKNLSGGTLPAGVAVMAYDGTDNLGVKAANTQVNSKRCLGVTLAASENTEDVDVIYGGKCTVMILAGSTAFAEHSFIMGATGGKGIGGTVNNGRFAIALEAIDASGSGVDLPCECVIIVSELY